MDFNFKGRDIINGYDFTTQELCHIMDTAMIYEKRVKSGEALILGVEFIPSIIILYISSLLYFASLLFLRLYFTIESSTNFNLLFNGSEFINIFISSSVTFNSFFTW